MKKFVMSQIGAVIFIIVFLILLYPRVGIEKNSDIVRFYSTLSLMENGIEISKSKDFSNSGVLEVGSEKIVKLEPGEYYFRPYNKLLRGFVRKLIVDSDVSLTVGEDYEVRNVGNVKINVKRTNDGNYVGVVQLSPNEGFLEDQSGVDYEGRQDG